MIHTRRFFVLFFLTFVILGPLQIQAAITVEISATVPGCGDALIRSGEQCDGANLGALSCQSLGFSGGPLSCTSACTLDTTSCLSGSFGGRSRGNGGVSIPATNVVFTGSAEPGNTVTLLKDAQVAATGIVDQSGNFQMTLFNIPGRDYVFSVYSEDDKGLRSPLVTFPVYVTSGATTKIDTILVTPVASLNQSEIRQKDSVGPNGTSGTVPLGPALLDVVVEPMLTSEYPKKLPLVFVAVVYSALFLGWGVWRRFFRSKF